MEARGRSADTSGHHTPGTVDDLFDYDVGLDEILEQTDLNQHNDSSNPASRRNDEPADSNGASLGLDEEIKVAPKRRPVAKLDEARLLSPAGIPKLRKNAKTKLKFRGKGHEYSDAMRLLNFYQLWLDDLYPRAKFADGLAMIEKLGHSKRIQIMRKEWIDEGKPRLYAADRDEETNNDTTQLPASNAAAASSDGHPQTENDNELFPAATTNTARRDPRTSPVQRNNSTVDSSTENHIPSIFGGGEGGKGKAAEHYNADSDDDLFVRGDRNDNAHVDINKLAGHVENSPEDDELEALLAEHEGAGMPSGLESKPSTTTTAMAKGSGSGLPPVSAFDDLDAMDDYDI
ncbi:replication fork protection complex subunit Csm3/Swi3 [Blastomyces dermatitidis ATCC 18188]|uniref:Chromosome segregation in meiosis protein n=1 Tax=Ajellomyces dermatitidis (strain ATCC 18188 / CBS 674.68) TaxID=653446 RepID=F2TPT3_AJEDA|nr:replication fork protection complex subunit Csm3/Swi3 [Blastomyces dermatitidis ATCC 18188]